MNKPILVMIISISFESLSSAQLKWSFEIHGGTAYIVPLPLQIHQTGYPTINFLAKFDSRSFRVPVYWDWRISRWQNNRSWEIEATHLKMFMKNTTTDVSMFNISHGFNIVTLNRGYKIRKLIQHSGIGFVLTHPESTIRNMFFNPNLGILKSGYYISGPALNYGIAYPLNLSRHWFLNLEGKSTFAFTRINIVQGYANVYNFTFHLILGIGNNFIIRE